MGTAKKMVTVNGKQTMMNIESDEVGVNLGVAWESAKLLSSSFNRLVGNKDTIQGVTTNVLQFDPQMQSTISATSMANEYTEAIDQLFGVYGESLPSKLHFIGNMVAEITFTSAFRVPTSKVHQIKDVAYIYINPVEIISVNVDFEMLVVDAIEAPISLDHEPEIVEYFKKRFGDRLKKKIETANPAFEVKLSLRNTEG